jgi:regulator of protease activity HflC (stomatin/prohibitin superfamily)
MILFSPGIVVVLSLLIFVIVLVVKGITIVQQAEVVIIERLGKYDRTLTSGINIIYPFVEKPRPILWKFEKVDIYQNRMVIIKEVNRIDLREQIYDFPKQSVITKDNVNIQIDALIYFQITDAVRAVYEIANLPHAIEKLTKTTLRNVVGELDLDGTLTSRDTINAKIRAILDDATDKWGVKVNRVEIQDISPPSEIKEQMEKQMRAERDRRAAILTAEGQKMANILEAEGKREAFINEAEGIRQSEILKAEGDANARIKRAEAEAEAIRIITNAISTSSDPVQYLVAVRYIEALQEMVSGKDNKVVYIPYEATAVLGSIGGIKDLLSIKA